MTYILVCAVDKGSQREPSHGNARHDDKDQNKCIAVGHIGFPALHHEQHRHEQQQAAHGRGEEVLLGEEVVGFAGNRTDNRIEEVRDKHYRDREPRVLLEHGDWMRENDSGKVKKLNKCCDEHGDELDIVLLDSFEHPVVNLSFFLRSLVLLDHPVRFVLNLFLVLVKGIQLSLCLRVCLQLVVVVPTQQQVLSSVFANVDERQDSAENSVNDADQEEQVHTSVLVLDYRQEQHPKQVYNDIVDHGAEDECADQQLRGGNHGGERNVEDGCDVTHEKDHNA